MLQANNVLLLEPDDRRWTTFAAAMPDANVFHHPAWVKLLALSYGYRPFVIAVSDSGGSIRAALPMMEISSRLRGRHWVSLPFTDYCAPLSCDDEALRCLTEQLMRLAQESPLSKIEVRAKLPQHAHISTESQFVRHTLQLCPDADQVAKKFHRTQRQNIKTAEKHGIRVVFGTQKEHLETFYRLQLLTRHKQGVPVQPWHFFELFLPNLIEQDLGFIALAYKDGECLAAGLFLHWQKTLIYKYAASLEDGRGLRPNHLLSWTVMQWACEHGFTTFDYGRTDRVNEGLRTFKNRWGADEQPLEYSVIPTSAAHPENDRFIGVVHSIIRGSPLWVCRAAGEVLYRHLG
jgi:FemAB-related protein (PEP-CTERM system-associated)